MLVVDFIESWQYSYNAISIFVQVVNDKENGPFIYYSCEELVKNYGNKHIVKWSCENPNSLSIIIK